MTITIQWWMWVIALFLFPFLYAYLSEKFSPTGDYGFDFMPILVVFGCWGVAAGILVAKLF